MRLNFLVGILQRISITRFFGSISVVSKQFISIDIRLNDIRSSLPFGRMNRHGSFAETETALMASVSRSTAAARSRGSMVNISIEWEVCVGASIIVATRR